MNKLTHVDVSGAARMVDVSEKADTMREATAACTVTMKPETLKLIMNGAISKGDVLAVARIAGIMAAKKTAELIPLCHPLPITNAELTFEPDAQADQLRIMALVRVTGKTGVEMEALTAAAVAGLTVYDMCKSVDREMVIGDVRLIRKSGGKSGTFERREIRKT